MNGFGCMNDDGCKNAAWCNDMGICAERPLAQKFLTESNPHHLTPLPDCMMPDGAEPCRGYSVMLDAAVQAGIRNAAMQLDINRLNLDLAFCREAMRHADIDLSMILPFANSDMQKSIRKTLGAIDKARKRTTTLSSQNGATHE